MGLPGPPAMKRGRYGWRAIIPGGGGQPGRSAFASSQSTETPRGQPRRRNGVRDCSAAPNKGSAPAYAQRLCRAPRSCGRTPSGDAIRSVAALPLPWAHKLAFPRHPEVLKCRIASEHTKSKDRRKRSREACLPNLRYREGGKIETILFSCHLKSQQCLVYAKH